MTENNPELEGLLELCKMYGKNIDIAEKKGGMYFEKPMFRNITTLKPDLDYKNLIHTEFLAVSDTHLGSIKQQLHL